MSSGIIYKSAISGMKFLDANRNGVKDTGETGLAGWTIWADLNKNGVQDPEDPSAVTAADGTYRLIFYLPGQASATLKVYEVQQTGYLQTYPASGYNQITIDAGYEVTNVDFGNYPSNPHISLTKDAAESSYDAVNDVIHYTLVATNDGNVTLHNVTITDPKLGTLTFTPSAPATLAPGATLTATGSHTITQSDLDAGFYDNTATAAGLGPQNQPVTAEASEHDARGERRFCGVKHRKPAQLEAECIAEGECENIAGD